MRISGEANGIGNSRKSGTFFHPNAAFDPATAQE
jgi:hypothetical protein